MTLNMSNKEDVAAAMKRASEAEAERLKRGVLRIPNADGEFVDAAPVELASAGAPTVIHQFVQAAQAAKLTVAIHSDGEWPSAGCVTVMKRGKPGQMRMSWHSDRPQLVRWRPDGAKPNAVKGTAADLIKIVQGQK